MEYIALFLLGILAATNANDFFVAAPSTLRLNTEEIIGIAVDIPQAVPVNIEIRDHPGNQKIIFQSSFFAKRGEPQKVKIKLDSKEFPPQFLSTPGTRKYVSLKVKIRHEKKEIQIPITSEYGYMFITSDKPIYTPKERASFRIIPLTEEGTPSKEGFKFQIKNPDGIVVDEKIFSTRRHMKYSFETHHYQFPQYPKVGEWTAVARYGNNYELNSTLTFELQEYVLPTFIVNITTPDIIIPSDESIDITVEAKHTYGIKVSGIVFFRFGVKKEHSSQVTYFMSLNRPKALYDGIATANIQTKEFRNHAEIGWFPRIEGSTLVVEVTVVDDDTGNKLVEIDSKGRFSKSPYLISLKRCLGDFKPGLITVFQADITHVNGRPAVGVPTKLTALADNRFPLRVVNNSPKSDEIGRVTFEIHTETHHREIKLTLKTDDRQYGDNQAQGICMQKSSQSRSNAYIAISRLSHPALRPNDVFSRDIHLEPNEIKDIYFMVVVRGRIQKFEKLHEGRFKLRHMSFSINHDMVPNFRIIVFAHHGNELLADSLKIDVEKVCSPEAEVKLDTDFKDTEPGIGGKIILSGRKGISVGVFGVDKAVYAMSRSVILRREKIFDELASHDLGCGFGGGLTVNSILGKAGIMLITNKFSSSHSDSCGAINRKKRATVEDIVSRYPEEVQRCCKLGLTKDKYDRICEDLLYTAEKSLDDIHENCSKIFLKCCKEGENPDLDGTVLFTPEGRFKGPNHDGMDIITPDKIDEIERLTTVRKDFKETWFNNDYIIGSNNKTEVSISLPHSITTWIIQAVSVSPTHGVCVSDPKSVLSFKRVFLHLNIPYSIKQYEQVEIHATVFNYGYTPLLVYVYMHETPGICASMGIDKKSERINMTIDANSAKAVNFPIVPLTLDTFPIKFAAISQKGSDVVERTLNIVPRGIRQSDEAVIKLDPTNRQKRLIPRINNAIYSDFIESSQNKQITILNVTLPVEAIAAPSECTITATGEAVGPVVETSLNNPDHLIQMPHGCGEQNMMRLAPTIFTLRYLENAKKLTPAQKEKAFQYIRAGYSNELNFKKADGSYSVWAHTPASTWLTAFVMKVFCQGTKFIPLDDKVITSGIQWLLNDQLHDGSYEEKNKVYHWDMMGGVNGKASMTAYALISLEECKNEQEKLTDAREKARKYLETYANTVETPLPAAIVAYALALSNSAQKIAANDRLLSMARHEQDKNYMYWKTKNSAQDIETAGYALLTQLQLNDLDRSTSIVNWLNTMQLKGGEFKSTQDTVVALQALSEYAIKAPNAVVNLVSTFTSSSDKNFSQVFTFNNSNALEPQHFKIDNPDGMIFVHTSGTGVGTLTMELKYSVLKPEHEICKFLIKESITKIENGDPLIRKVHHVLNKEPERRRKRRQLNNELNALPNEDEKLVYKLEVCIRYLGEEPTEMSIADVGIFSGFEPVIEDLDRIQNDPHHLIQRFEKSSRNIVFYLDSVPIDEDYCFSFHIERQFVVGNTQSSVIKVYDYYNPDEVCTQFYSPNKENALVRKICTEDNCHCAEGGCPPETFSDEVLKITNIADRRDRMKDMFCQDFDYVWIGKLSKRPVIKEGYKLITFKITDVIKEGKEGKSKIENQTRILRAHEYCETAEFFVGATYLIIGKDPINHGAGDEAQNEYFLDKKSFIHYWQENKKPSERSKLQGDLEAVKKDIGKDGCG